MKTTTITLAAIFMLIIAACSATKKSTSSTDASVPVSTSPLIFLNPNAGFPMPGNEELTAIQLQYKDVTLDLLKEGHTIYTEGACIKCHSAQNIYKYRAVQWVNIIEDMAYKAKISDTQKDAVYKYVLAIKATQTKDAK